MTWRRYLTAVRASVELGVLGLIAQATNARLWLRDHLGRGEHVPPDVHWLVAPTPDDDPVVVIDVTERDPVSA